MRRRGIAVLMAVLMAVYSVGCSTPVDSQQPPSGATSHITIGESVDFTSFEPIGSMDAQGFAHYSGLVYETLVNFVDGQPQAALAESWENNGTEWVLHLRRGVTFSDGEAFNADVVKLNIEALSAAYGDYIPYYGSYSKISEINVVDDYTISIVYTEPYPNVLQEFSASIFSMLSPKMFEGGNVPYGDYSNDTAGTGPYMLKQKDAAPGQSYTFTSNPNWWGQKSGPDSFTVKIIPDEDARMIALEAGEIDLLYGSYQITYDMFDQLAKTGSLSAQTSEKTYTTRNLLLNASHDILADLNVRRAIQHGTNKQQIVDTVLHGMEVKADALFSPDLPNCDVVLSPYAYDTDLANRLLDEAGWTEKGSDGIRVKDGQPLVLRIIYQSSRPSDEQILMAFKGQMSELGIGVEIQGFETMAWFERGMEGAFDVSVNDTYDFPQDPHVFLTAMLDDGLDKSAQQNLAELPELTQHIQSMMSTVDAATLEDDYEYVLTTLHDEALYVSLSYVRELVVFDSSKIEGYVFADEALRTNITALKLA